MQQEDDEGMFALDSNPDVQRYLGNKTLDNIEQSRAIIALIQKQYTDFGIGRWATIEKSTGAFIGWSGLKWMSKSENNQKPNPYHDIGYRFIPKYWGKGYGTESAKAALKFGFEQLNLSKIIGTCHEENKASRHILEKCGLKFKNKFLYQNELPCDWLSITKEEWQQQYFK
jgi:RimJ/RimL family protein N-acetyltransferase